MTYSEAIQYLQSLQVFGARFGLETPRKLAELSGQPQDKLRFIHVAGTNGKGSVCAMLESIYRAAGLKVGLYTSPHLVSFRERVQINRQLISEADVAKHTCELLELARRLPQDQPVTFFEFVTLMALRHFAEQKCDLVIWETGLGGRLDATNIVKPLASVITNIGHDHQQWLGNTLAEIAFEKAGIIKRGVPVITGTDQPEALAVITETAQRKDAPLTLVRPADAVASFPSNWKPPLLGEHQKANAALAAATVHAIHSQLPVPAGALKLGLETVWWPGRLQLVTSVDGRLWLLDGAHNLEGVETLHQTLKQDFANEPKTLIVGMLADKDWQGMVQRLAPLFDEIHAVPVASNRSLSPAQLAEALGAANPAACVFTHESASQCLTGLASTPFTVVTGSLYLIGEVMERLGISTSPAESERGLNEWTTR